MCDESYSHFNRELFMVLLLVTVAPTASAVILFSVTVSSGKSNSIPDGLGQSEFGRPRTPEPNELSGGLFHEHHRLRSDKTTNT